MATGPKSGHVRADSGIDGLDPMSKTLATAQNFCTAVSLFASENGVQALTELLELLPRRENEIKLRDDMIRDLNAGSGALEKSHSIYTQKQLSVFEDRYEDWSETNTTLQSEVEELKKACKEKDTEITALRDDLEINKTINGDLELESSENTKRLKEKNQQIVDLDSRLQNTLADAEHRRQELNKSHDQMAVLKRTLKDEAEKYRKLYDEAKKMKEGFQKVKQFSVKITELDLQATGDRIEALWMDAIKLVEHYAGKELSQEILQVDWTELRENNFFIHRIPLPQSNSEIAKQMRIALTLGILAQLIDSVVFQPIYLLREENGLRDVLYHQATIDPMKEAHTRGILLSMDPEEQESNIKKGISIIVKDLLSSVGLFLTSDDSLKFGDALERLVKQFQKEWKVIQCGRQKLETEFVYSVSIDHPWHIFDLRTADAKVGQDAPADLVTRNMEDNVVIIPQLCLIGAGAEPTPVTHGCVLRKAHLDAAEDEYRRWVSSAPLARGTSNRHRNRSVRAMSGTSNVASSWRNSNRFLSHARGPPES